MPTFTDALLIMEKSKKIVLFDIDYTLFDTDAYRQILYPQLAQELGVSEEDLLRFRKEFEPEMKATIGHYSPDFFLQRIQTIGKNKISLEKLEEIFWNKVMYSDVLNTQLLDVLTSLQKENISIGILSTGDKRHQLAKIESVLAFFPKENHHIFPNKLESMKDVLEKYSSFQIFIIDDLPEVLVKAKEINSEVVTVLRKVEKQSETTKLIEGFRPDYEIEDLNDIINIVIK
jgi:FMN phosphatase YigB (HAD superfamily)